MNTFDHLNFAHVVYEMQASISCLAIFLCSWGFTQFAPCLWRVLTLKLLPPKYSHCQRHAVAALICLSGIILAFARLNTIGFMILGSTTAGLAYIGGMILLVFTVTVAVWSLGRAHNTQENALQGWRTPIQPTPQLSRLIGMVLIITLAFLGVGLLRLGS